MRWHLSRQGRARRAIKRCAGERPGRVRAAAAIRRRVHDEEEQEDGALALVGGALGAAAALLGAGSRVLVGSALRGAGDQREDPDEKQRTGSAHDLLVEKWGALMC